MHIFRSIRDHLSRHLSKWTVVAATALGLGWSSNSYAVLKAHEGFNYTGGLNTQNGGTGFGSNAWTAVSGYASPALTSGSLTYSNGGNTLVTSGNKVQPAVQSRSTRNFPSTIATANQTFWVSFRINQTDTTTLPTNHAGFQFCDLTNGNLSGSSQIFLGKPFNSTNWGFQLGATVNQKAGAVTTADRNALLVYKLVFTSTQVTGSMWVNPPLTTEAAMGSPAITSTVSYAFNFNSMWVGTGNNSANYQFDEFRFGTVFADIVPTTLIASENFNYTGNLNTKTGGTGFGTNAWTAVSGYANPAIATGSLTYTNGSDTLVTGGNKLQPAVQSRSTRNFPTTITTANQTLWVSFRANQTGTGTLPTNHAGFQFCDLTNGNLSGTSQIFLGKPFNATNWGFQLAGTVGQKAGAVTAADRDALLVYKLVFTSSQVTCSMWVDPPLTSEGALGTPALTNAVAYAFNFNSMWVGTGNNAASYQFDEFRFATNFADVTPHTTSGSTIVCNTSAEFQTALSTAQLGDTIVLTAPNTFTGTFTLPNRTTGSGYITIRSSAIASLPVAGRRVNLTHASLMPKIKPTNYTDAAISTAASAHHFKLIGLEIIGTQSGSLESNRDLVELGRADLTQTSLSVVPNNIIIDRCIIRAASNTHNLKRGVGLNSASTDIINSYICNIKHIGADSQAIAGFNGPGPFNIINNYLEGAGENVMFGGDDPKILNLVPSDIVIKQNHMFKPLSWNPNDTANYAGTAWVAKNVFELKNARNLLIDGNIFENSWQPDQDGFVIVFTPRNQGGTAPWSVVENVTFTNNICRNGAMGVSVMGNDNNHPSQTTNHVTLRNNLLYNIGGSKWGAAITGRLFFISRGVDTLTIDHNTSFHTNAVLFTDGPTQHTGFVFTNNMQAHNSLGVFSSQGSGSTCLNTWYPNCTFQKNVLMNNAGLNLTSLFSGHTGGWSPANLAFPTSWGPSTIAPNGVLVNQASPGTDFAGWKVVTGSNYDNTGTDGADIGCNIDTINTSTAGCISGVWP